MEPLVSLNSLALWSQRDPDEVEVDPWAIEVVREFSDYARFLGNHVDWTATGETAAPYDVRRAVLMACRRTYTNPDSEVQTGVGPISARVLDEAALAGAFTQAELDTITGYGDGTTGATAGGFYILRGGGSPTEQPKQRLFVPDDQQINIDTTNAAPSWDIPMFNLDDPGGEG